MLLFGVTDDGSIKGTSYRNDGKLQSLKKEIAECTNQRMTFREIHELCVDGKRVIAFIIPPALPGIPTTWNGATYAREHESVCALPLDKLDDIRHQTGPDWSKTLVSEADFEDLDQEAVDYACKLFAQRQGKSVEELLSSFSQEEILCKAGLLIKGQVTYSALLLLGKAESIHFFDGFLESQKRIIMMWSRCREVLERIKTYQYTLCEKRQEIIEEQSALNNLFNDMFELVSNTKQILHKYSSYIIEQSSTEAIGAYSSIGIDLFEENAEAHHWLDARTRLIHNLNTIKEMYDSLIKSSKSLDAR